MSKTVRADDSGVSILGSEPGAGMEAELPSTLRCVDLTDRVRGTAEAGVSPFSGDATYRAFFDRLARALHRSGPRHVLLTRERGVGEQAVMVELARRCVTGEVRLLAGRRVISVDCRHVSPTESVAAAEAVFRAATNEPEVVLCLDGFVSLLRGPTPAGNWPAVAAALGAARCRVVGIVSPHEYEERLASDADCQDIFSVVHLHEPEPPVAVRLVQHFAASLCDHYRLGIDPAAIRRTVTLSNNYIHHERLPQKAVRVLRAICDDVAFDRAQSGATKDRITEEDAIAKIAEFSGVPAHTLAGVGERVDYRQSLGEAIVGQPHAVEEVATELGLLKAGFADEGKPASVMLFIGQTGTGKTEMAKALARLYSTSKRLRTFTLGNFSEPHSVSGIIGVPPGYVGHDQGGRLVNDLNADPYAVFLLDEADKAHPDVMQPFLNLFDEGWIYDQRGVKAYADRALFILTTNVGQRQIADLFKAGKPLDEITHTMKEVLARTRHSKSNRPVFTPEFLARIKRVIVFKPLDAQAMLGITRKLVADMIDDWAQKRQRRLVVPAAMLDWIAEQAHNANEKSQGREGGRVVRKILAEQIEAPIQRAISEAIEAYRACGSVVIEFEASAQSESGVARREPERVRVRFEG